MERNNLSKIDFSGMEKGLLKVINRVPGTKSLWNCECKCGNKVQLYASRLTDPKRKSCGCLEEKSRESFGSNHTTHGLTSTRLYKTYRGMINRCYNPNIKGYKDYGGRGIKICDEWLSSFERFAEWSYKNGYKEENDRLSQSIDRIDNNGNYEPSNCRWTDSRTQSINKRSTYEVYYNGERTTISEVCELCGITDKSFAYRRFKKGQSLDEIIDAWAEKENIPENLIECSEYADKLGVCTASVTRMIREGKLKGMKRGRKWYILKE